MVVHTLVYMPPLLPGYVHPSYTSRVHHRHQHCTQHATRYPALTPATALTRAVAEQTVRQDPLTVVTVRHVPITLFAGGQFLLSRPKPKVIQGRGRHAAQSGARPPVPVSLLGNLSYVTIFSLSARYEGIRRVYAGVLSPCVHPFHWPTLRIGGYSRVGIFSVTPCFKEDSGYSWTIIDRS